ncbi:MAG: tRNA uracil 4-sulfurtransferase ThiI [Nitrososphaerales archaeon]|jgi:thiamine biosynthesis protein ThiI
MADAYVVHYSEVALKGKNRPEFVRVLRRNIAKTLAPLHPSVESRDGRFIVTSDTDSAEVALRLSRVFGVAWFARANVVDADYGKIEDAVLETARASTAQTFRVDPRRTDKRFPISSMELARKLGSAVAEETGKGVDLSDPGLRIHVDIIRSRALIYATKIRGPGGLPVGTAGRVMHLFSGGIDSPVAAWLLLKRGVRPIYLHFYLAPTSEAPMQGKIAKLLKVLSGWGGKSTLVMVPFAMYQLETAEVPGELEPSLFRRFMRMTAERLAPQFRASAVSTGDSLSQAASQTLWNIGVFDSGSSLPVLRPLLSYDKEEVVDLARRIGTYDLSLEDYKDCCAIITRHPRTRAKIAKIAEYAEGLCFEKLISRSLESASLASYSPKNEKMKTAPLSDVIHWAPTGQTPTSVENATP